MKLKKQLESGSRGRQVAHGRDDGGGVPDGQPHQSQHQLERIANRLEVVRTGFSESP